MDVKSETHVLEFSPHGPAKELLKLEQIVEMNLHTLTVDPKALSKGTVLRRPPFNDGVEAKKVVPELANVIGSLQRVQARLPTRLTRLR